MYESLKREYETALHQLEDARLERDEAFRAVEDEKARAQRGQKLSVLFCFIVLRVACVTVALLCVCFC